MASVATSTAFSPSPTLLNCVVCASRTSWGNAPYTMLTFMPGRASSICDLMLNTCFREKHTTQSPRSTFLRSPPMGSVILSGTSRSCHSTFSASSSPVLRSSFLITGIALGSPHRWISRAGNPSKARVHAQPRSLSPIIWISSITPTSMDSSNGHISTVQLMNSPLPLKMTSSPMTSSHGTPALFTFSQTCAASSFSGAQYTPDRAFIIRSRESWVFPLFVGPAWK
eukprot:gene1012-biopygen1024